MGMCSIGNNSNASVTGTMPSSTVLGAQSLGGGAGGGSTLLTRGRGTLLGSQKAGGDLRTGGTWSGGGSRSTPGNKPKTY